MNPSTKRLTSVILAVFLTFSLILAGCGGSSPATSSINMYEYREDMGYADGSADYYESPSAVAEAEGWYSESTAADSAQGGVNVALEDRKVVRHSDLSLETKEFDQAYAQIPELIKAAGGYIQSQSMDGRSMYYSGDYYERRASIYARVPADKLDEVTASVGSLCNISSQSERMDDITDSYFDAEARLNTLRVQEERLLEILKQAETLEDIITLERALTQVRYEIESLTASLQRMDSQVAYSYLNISLREVVDYTIPVVQPKNFGERLGESFSKAWYNLTTTFEVMLFFLIENLPVIVVFALFVLVIVVIVRGVRRVWRKRKPAAPKAPPMAPGGQPPQATWAPGGFQRHPGQVPPPEPPKPDPEQ